MVDLDLDLALASSPPLLSPLATSSPLPLASTSTQTLMDALPVALPLPLMLAFYVIYETVSPCFKTEKQRAYLLSSISAATVSLVSLPFVWTYLVHGLGAALDAGEAGTLGVVGRGGVVFFGTYLFADLLIGYFKYPSQVGLLTGWVHHICYIALMVYLADSRMAPIFLIAGIMEVPTLDLALSNLFPSIRHDERFLITFFLLRILFHLVLLADCVRPSSRALTEGSWFPTVMLALAGALHVSWFRGGLHGYLKRRARSASSSSSKKQKNASKVSKAPKMDGSAPVHVDEPLVDAAIRLDPTVVDSTLPLSQPAAGRRSGTATPEDSPLATPHTPGQTPMTLRDSYLFPTLPTLPNLSNLPNLPTLPAIPMPTMISFPSMPMSMTMTLPPLSEISAAGFKDAVRNRWEAQRGRFVRDGALGGLGLRRRKGTGGEGEGDGEIEGEGRGKVETQVLVREVEVEGEEVHVHVH